MHLAQLNIAQMKGENIEDPVMSSFVAQLDEINGLAEASSGFLWRLKDDSDDRRSKGTLRFFAKKWGNTLCVYISAKI
ncbi:MAG: DUF3291 domain-containing protein [Saprospiraceae bacterium]|nr:DUF3291 domain-containing protein [Saprospiraceae bacterium]